MSRSPVTAAHGFHVIDGRPLFSVNPGLPLGDALEQASNLLESIERLTVVIGSDCASVDHRRDAFAASYLAEMAKALVDACAAGAQRARGDE